MTKINCWEFKKCGRENGGAKVHELGVCPSAIAVNMNGLNNGNNGGRICWVIAGSFCGGKVQGTFAEKQPVCMSCDFYKKVVSEEPVETFKLMPSGQSYKK